MSSKSRSHTHAESWRFAGSIFSLSEVPRPVIYASLTSNILNVALPLAVLQVYDRIIPNQSIETLVLLLSSLLAIIAIDVIIKVARGYFIGWQAAERAGSASVRAAAIIAATPTDRLARERHTDWLDRIEAAAQIELGHGGQAQLVVLDFLFLPIFPLVIALVAGPLVAIPLGVMCLLGLAIRLHGRQLSKAIEERTDHDRRRHDFLSECLGSIETVKALAMEPQMVRRFERLAKASSLISLRAIESSQALQLIAGAAANVMLVSVVSCGALFIMFGDLTVGGLACCSLLSGRMMQPVLRAAGVWAEVQSQKHARERIAPLEALKPAPQSIDTRTDRTGPAHIAFDNVSLSISATSPLLDSISVEFKPGEVIGLSGDTAAWSAAFAIMSGDLEPSHGVVSIDGQDVRAYGEDLRRQIVRASSTSHLFRGTVLENLTLFEGGETVDRARKIARDIGLEDKINRLPKGFDTEVGLISSLGIPGGVAQLIVITRALVREPRALLFNEANTALDEESDATLRRVLSELRGRKTVLINSSRPSLLRIAERHIAIHSGRIAESDDSRATDQWMRA